MDEWVIRGAIAVVAAIIGAIIRPFVDDYLLRRREAKSTYREMIDSWLNMTRRKYSYGLLAVQLIREGTPPKEVAPQVMAAFKEYLTKLDKGGGNKWPFDPKRIPYDDIRELLVEANNVTLEILTAVNDLAKTGSAGDLEGVVKANVARCEEIRDEVITAMTAKGI